MHGVTRKVQHGLLSDPNYTMSHVQVMLHLQDLPSGGVALAVACFSGVL